jgi:hypothetical protein
LVSNQGCCLGFSFSSSCCITVSFTTSSSGGRDVWSTYLSILLCSVSVRESSSAVDAHFIYLLLIDLFNFDSSLDLMIRVLRDDFELSDLTLETDVFSAYSRELKVLSLYVIRSNRVKPPGGLCRVFWVQD